MVVGNAPLYLTVDGSKASVMGSIEGQQARPMAVTDKEYSCYRASHDVVGVVDEDEERIVLKTAEGFEEEWLRPKWVLNGVRRARPTTR